MANGSHCWSRIRDSTRACNRCDLDKSAEGCGETDLPSRANAGCSGRPHHDAQVHRSFVVHVLPCSRSAGRGADRHARERAAHTRWPQTRSWAALTQRQCAGYPIAFEWRGDPWRGSTDRLWRHTAAGQCRHRRRIWCSRSPRGQSNRPALPDVEPHLRAEERSVCPVRVFVPVAQWQTRAGPCRTVMLPNGGRTGARTSRLAAGARAGDFARRARRKARPIATPPTALLRRRGR